MAVNTTQGDLTPRQHEYFRCVSQLAWDIETSGLDWRTDSIGTCQLTDGSRTVIVQMNGHHPDLLADLLQHPAIQKVFHHAMFDLRFMSHQWGVTPANIACTKIASKILDPNAPTEAHSLKALLRGRLGVRISKAQQQSDWLNAQLSDDQLKYAATDVAHLSRLLAVLLDELRQLGRLHLALESFAYVPARVQLDISGSGDVFTY